MIDLRVIDQAQIIMFDDLSCLVLSRTTVNAAYSVPGCKAQVCPIRNFRYKSIYREYERGAYTFHTSVLTLNSSCAKPSICPLIQQTRLFSSDARWEVNVCDTFLKKGNFRLGCPSGIQSDLSRGNVSRTCRK